MPWIPRFFSPLSPLHADCRDKRILSLQDIDVIVHTDLSRMDNSMGDTVPEPVSGDDIFYIIFTSGSTGTPKGVTITERNLSNFLDWSITLGTSTNAKKGKVFLNQAPFSFDLSVMDLYTCLAVGGTLWCLTKDVQKDYQKLLESLKRSGCRNYGFHTILCRCMPVRPGFCTDRSAKPWPVSVLRGNPCQPDSPQASWSVSPLQKS